MKLPLYFALFLFNTSLLGQDQELSNTNPRVERPVGINAIVGGPGIYSLSVDYYAAPTVNLEAGLGPAIFAGIRYHLNGQKAHKAWTPFTGIYGTYFWVFEGFTDDFGGNVPIIAYIPLGIQFNGKKGFSFSFEISAFTNFESTVRFAGLKVGHHF